MQMVMEEYKYSLKKKIERALMDGNDEDIYGDDDIAEEETGDEVHIKH
jgi:hypothetical protein